jgi:hypothetical protein
MSPRERIHRALGAWAVAGLVLPRRSERFVGASGRTAPELLLVSAKADPRLPAGTFSPAE